MAKWTNVTVTIDLSKLILSPPNVRPFLTTYSIQYVCILRHIFSTSRTFYQPIDLTFKERWTYISKSQQWISIYFVTSVACSCTAITGVFDWISCEWNLFPILSAAFLDYLKLPSPTIKLQFEERYLSVYLQTYSRSFLSAKCHFHQIFLISLFWLSFSKSFFLIISVP